MTDGGGTDLLRRMKSARSRFYEATRELDAIWQGRKTLSGTEALEAALSPYIRAADALPVG